VVASRRALALGSRDPRSNSLVYAIGNPKRHVTSRDIYSQVGEK